MKHKTQDYKITAVKYYLQNDDSLDDVCSIFACKKTSFRRWIMKYKKDKHLKRLNRPSMSYKINNIIYYRAYTNNIYIILIIDE